MKRHTRDNAFLYFVSALFSLLLGFAGYLRASVINPDGICYVQSAATLAQANLATAMQLCGQAQWPFYSVLIYAVAAVTKLSYVHAAFVLNNLLSLISVLTFIYIVHLLGGSRRIMWMAAATILLMHEFNGVREYIVRDHGFWAFYLVSIALLIQFFRHPGWRYALLWSGSMLVATAFRVEGVIFLVLMPLLALFTQQRWRSLWQLNVVTLVLVVMVLIFAPHHSNRLQEIQFQVLHGFTQIHQNFQQKSAALGRLILNGYSVRDAGWIFGLTLIQWYVVSLITNLSIIYTILACYALKRKLLQFDPPARLVILGGIAVNVFITVPFLVEFMFLSKRYLIALSLLLALAVPFALDYIWMHRKKHLYVLAATILLVLASAAGGIFDFGYSKAYIRNAGDWLAANAPPNAKIYSNNYQVLFYSQHFGNDIFAKARAYANLNAQEKDQWQQYDYIAIYLDHCDQLYNPALAAMKTPPLQVFANKRGDKVFIYKTNPL